MQFIHHTETQYLPPDQLKEKQYKDYFEFCVKETGMRFDYPKDRDKIGDGVVDGDEMILALSTDNNINVLRKIKENIYVRGYIVLGIDSEENLIYAAIGSGGFLFDRMINDVGSDCIVPATGENTSQIVGRSYQYTPDPESAKDNNRAKYYWLKENQPEKLVMEDLWIGTNFFIRTQDFYYDIPAKPIEQYILINLGGGNDGLKYIIQDLQSRGYMLFFNSVYTQSVPEIRHGHIIKF